MNYKRLGYQFEKEVGEGLSKLKGWYFKIPDTRTMQFTTVKVPADYIWCGPDSTIFLEAKQTSKTRFPLRNIKEHQLRISLKVNSMTATKYFLIIYFKYHKRCFLIRPEYLIDAWDVSIPYQSIPLELFEQKGIEVKRFTAKYNNNKCAYIDLRQLYYINKTDMFI